MKKNKADTKTSESRSIKKSSKSGFFKNYIVPSALTFAVISAGCIFFRPVTVSGVSMETTFHDGDSLIASTMADIERGDVIVFHSEQLDKTLIKRVIASEGDTVDIDFKKGIVYVNGKQLDETAYTKEPTYNDERGQTYPVKVPKDCYFVMGDNRLESLDSRSSKVSFVEQDAVIGKVVLQLNGLKGVKRV